MPRVLALALALALPACGDSSGSTTEGSTGASTNEPITGPACPELTFAPLSHPAFEGMGSVCGVPSGPAVYTSDAELLAHTTDYCQLQCGGLDPCPEPPTLPTGQVAAYIEASFETGCEATVTVHWVEDCGDQVNVRATVEVPDPNCDAPRSVWSTITFDDPGIPIVFDITEP